MNDLEMNFSVEKLRDILKKNRDSHAKQAAEMREEYRIAFLKILRQKVSDLMEGKEVDQKIQLDEPFDYLKLYDDILLMFEHTTSDTVSLTIDQYRQYVCDEWPRKRHFFNISESYKNYH